MLTYLARHKLLILTTYFISLPHKYEIFAHLIQSAVNTRDKIFIMFNSHDLSLTLTKVAGCLVLTVHLHVHMFINDLCVCAGLPPSFASTFA